MLGQKNGKSAITRKPYPNVGALVISLDFEIHWGVRDKTGGNGIYRENLRGVYAAVPQMLDLFEMYDIAATWATVGFLFAASRHELMAFRPVLLPEYENPVLSPYAEPLHVGEEHDRLYFAPDLIAEIQRRPKQEIGSHTFSHYYCLERGQSRAAFEADLESAVSIARMNGIQLRSIVLPRNQVNPDYRDLLLKAGIDCYRGIQTSRIYTSCRMGQAQLHRRGAKFLDQFFALSGSNVVSWDDVPEQNGLCNVALSRFLRPYNPNLKHLDSLRLDRIVKGMEAAALSNGIYHLCWHPHNFGTNTQDNVAFLRQVLEAFARFRKSHGMRSMTMADVADIAKGSAARVMAEQSFGIRLPV